MTTLSKKQRKMRNRILIAAALLVLVKLLPLTGWVRGLCCLAPYFIIGYDVLRKAALGIVNGQVFDENFLMALATVGAYATGEFDEAVFVMLFYQTGELFQDYAVGKSRTSIAALMDIRPDTANLETENGLETVDPEDVAVGSHKIRNGGTRLMIGGALALQGRIIPVGFLVNISPPIIRQFQRFRKDDGSPVIDHDKRCDFTGNATAFIIVPHIVGVQAVRDSIPPDADAGEQRRLSANRDFFVTFGHCIKGHKAFLLKFQ